MESEIWRKWTSLQNRNRLIVIEKRLVVGGVPGGMNWECEINRCKLLYIECINNSVLLYSIENYWYIKYISVVQIFKTSIVKDYGVLKWILMCQQYSFIQFKSVILKIETNALYFTYFLQIVENFEFNLFNDFHFFPEY